MLRKKLMTVATVVVLGLSMLLSGCGGTSGAKPTTAEVKTLRVGAIPAEDSEKVRKTYQALGSYLEKKTGMKVEIFVATDYTGVVEAMRAGKLDVAQYGPFSYILAAEKAGAEAFVMGKTKGSTSYNSVIITKPNSSIKTLADLKGHTFALVDPASTSGNLVPRSIFKKNGIDPEKDFKSVTYAGGHDSAVLALKNDKVEAAATHNLNIDKMKQEGVITDQDYRVIVQSDPIPNSPWAFSKDLSPELKAKIKQAFLDVAKEDPSALNTSDGMMESYEPANDSDYNPIREVAKNLNLDVTKLK
ncbi:MAG: phosphonate ABC transporter substrate-binding protein [Firmicutes bacterium]|nr:phosphonate ABC transporter substrate-binding protein [Bacillota bacterium]